MPKRAFVTGASGFVGSALCEELARRGYEISALMRRTSSSANLGNVKIHPVTGDLRSADSLVAGVRGADVIFHVAGVVAARSREDFFAANAAGTRNLIEAARRAGGNLERFVYVSSLAAAGPSRPGQPRREEEESRPVSDYGASKLGGEREALAARHELPVTIVRPPAVYGPRDRGVLTFFQLIHRGLLPLLGTENPDPRRYSFVHVEDLVQGIALAGEAGGVASGEIFYLSGEGEFSWEEAMRTLARAMGKKPFPLRLPIPVMRGAGALCSAYARASGKALPFSLDKVKEIAAPAWHCSNAKAKRLLKFEPYWELEKGFAHTAEWYRRQGWL